MDKINVMKIQNILIVNIFIDSLQLIEIYIKLYISRFFLFLNILFNKLLFIIINQLTFRDQEGPSDRFVPYQ